MAINRYKGEEKIQLGNWSIRNRNSGSNRKKNNGGKRNLKLEGNKKIVF